MIWRCIHCCTLSKTSSVIVDIGNPIQSYATYHHLYPTSPVHLYVWGTEDMKKGQDLTPWEGVCAQLPVQFVEVHSGHVAQPGLIPRTIGPVCTSCLTNRDRPPATHDLCKDMRRINNI